MKNQFFTILAASTISLLLCSCSGPLKKTAHGFLYNGGTAVIKVECYTPSSIRVVKAAPGETPVPNDSWSLIAKPEKVRFSLEESDSAVVLRTSALTLTLDRSSCELFFADAEGRTLLRESAAEFSSPKQCFTLDKDELIYGLGQHQQGYFNLRGRAYDLRNWNTEVAIPVLHSSKGYAIWWYNDGEVRFEDGPDGTSFRSLYGDCIDYFIVSGENADSVIAGLRHLTGEASMYPLWVFGFHQSRERYVSQEQIVGVVEKYRELGVPLDGIIQDWQYWGSDHSLWNAVQFLNPEFPDPKSMMDRIHELNAHCSISIWPSFGPKTDIFRELDAEGLLLSFDSFPPKNGVRNYDAFDSRARDIYWSYIRKLYDIGLDGWWLDATEPEIQGPVPDDEMTAAGAFKARQNAFAIATVGGVYEHQRAIESSKRPFILTRSATLGIQRYGAHTWSGDVVSGWEELAAQVPAALSFTLSGLPYWNSDIGGFFAGHKYPDGNRDPEYRRLYLRWMQFACFTGMMRSHGTNTFREIYNFGQRGDFFFDAQEKFIRLRYALLPYTYSASYRIASAGASLMRPLMMDWPDDRTACLAADEYMYGDALLVAPVVEDKESRTVYLPEGQWYDFWDGKAVCGGRAFECDAPLDSMPLFVRAGSIIPMGPDVNYSGEKSWDSLEIRIYPGADASFVLYEDEFDNMNYESGKYSTIEFRWDDEYSVLTVAARRGSFDGMLEGRVFNVVLCDPSSAESCSKLLEYNGSSVSLAF